jgi:hypothetical protein
MALPAETLDRRLAAILAWLALHYSHADWNWRTTLSASKKDCQKSKSPGEVRPASG